MLDLEPQNSSQSALFNPSVMASSIHVAGVDTDLYSRQLGVLGLDAQVKLLKARVLIISMTGVGGIYLYDLSGL